MSTESTMDNAMTQTIGELDPSRLRGIKMMVFDCDGVLTDGRVWLDAQGNEVKAFSVIDGHGLAMLRESGVVLAMVSRDMSEIPRRRAEKLRFEEIHHGIMDKKDKILEVMARRNLVPEEVGFMGDDVPDLVAFEEVGLRLAPATARPEVIAAADAVTVAPAGGGAVREVCDAFLAARNT